MGYYDLFEEEYGNGDIPNEDYFHSRFDDDDFNEYADPFAESRHPHRDDLDEE